MATRAACCERGLRRFLAPLAQSGQRFLCGGDLLFSLDALQFQSFDFGLAGAKDSFLLGPLRRQSLQFELRDAEAFAHASHF